MITPPVFTPTPTVSGMLPPADEPYTPLYEATTGGVAIGDGSQGRRVQRWAVVYESPNCLILDEAGTIQATVPAPGALTVSLGFDTNNQYVLAWQTSTGSTLRYYDTLTSQYVSRDFPNTTSCRCATDDTRFATSGTSDVVFGYILDGGLYCRAQRDRYDVEYYVGDAPAGKLVRIGMTLGLRLTFIINPRL